MSRTIITSTDPHTGDTLTGWFDPASSTLYRAAREWNGHNRASVITGDEYADERRAACEALHDLIMEGV